MNKLLLLSLSAILLMGCNQKSTQTTHSPTNDSVQKYLALAENDTLDYNKRVLYNDKALSFIDLSKNDSLVRESLNRVNYLYLKTENFTKFKSNIDVYQKKVFEKRDSLGIANFHKHKGLYFHFLKINDSAYYHYLKAEYLFKNLNNEYEAAKIFLNKSYIQNDYNDYLGAELSAKKAYLFFKEKNLSDFQFQSLIILGNVYQSIGNNDEALKSYYEAMNLLRLINKTTKSIKKSNCLNNIGNLYREKKDYKKAFMYFSKAIKSKNLLQDDPSLLGILYNNTGYCYLMSKQLKSPQIFYKAKKILDSLNIKDESAMTDVYLSNYYILKKDSVTANRYAESALKLSKEANAPYYYLTALTHAGSINPKKAPLYIQEFKRINDSLLFAERSARNQYYKIQLETEEITQQKETALKQRTFLVLISLAVFLIAILIVIIARQRLKQKELRLQHTQQKANEEIYQLMLVQKAKEDAARQKEKKRIGLELHDGVMNKLTSTRLNLSVLSINKDKETVDKCLPYIHNIQAIENEIRNLTHNLNQKTALYEDGFEKLLTDLTAEQKQISPVDFQLKINSAIVWGKIDDIQKMNLYRILQEACQNINKHAKAKNAEINFAVNDQKLHLTITDDGIGIQPNNPQKGIGLKNIKYRVKQLGGKFILNSKPNQGTSLTITIPLKN
ncbi:ATP-binding protein [Flavobacterium sp.]|jgi:signal transduction histidine kinase|uniref:tetratricopeptide repeat-containing sensor histidine kinase n=1 Tax=Flavobacterium sp. TaxID=239 RepID=UPI0037BF34E9